MGLTCLTLNSGSQAFNDCYTNASLANREHAFQRSTSMQSNIHRGTYTAEICDSLKLAGFSDARVFWDHSEDENEDDFRPASKAENMPGWLAYVVGEK